MRNFLFKTLFVLAALAVAAVYFMGCKHEPKVGMCDMPPTTHEGYTLYQCNVDPQKPANACCSYLLQGPPETCFVVVCTEGCAPWKMYHRECHKHE